MKLSIVYYFISTVLLLIISPQTVDAHFFNWLWHKVEKLFNIDTRRTFDCGLSDFPQRIPSAIDQPRITGGISAAEHSWPWVVNIMNLGSLKTCGGTIVSHDTVITAAHCIVDDTDMIKVIAGAHNLFGRLNLFNYYSIESYIIHPGYVNCCDYDLAVIKMAKSFERSETINTICLPTDKNERLKIDTPAITVGWGGKFHSGSLNAFGSFSLKQGLVYIKSIDYCKQTYQTFDPTDELCATNLADSVDAREGDSGGALMVKNQTDNRWYLYGVTSHGSNTEIIKPGVYSSIINKLDFIKKYL
ncbi:unnamed protein product [Didymodactylos carnosus]|uniref:Peptidase S1 domain-containing protein n=1 Tax=Didymodactylos carnosus TaxID=1234261 RepID=A0A813X0X5_9BILA|nr:unnamed protein product [Didymodactylos carnosus]CAF1241291.1 unnamed protein product [Didymodactylos carnosus]CAF3647735.1 unnamed protein product [Didymodactylos carnosus]CAF4048812.1 unnamed protein product [Didymodactylos carnosus]